MQGIALDLARTPVEDPHEDAAAGGALAAGAGVPGFFSAKRLLRWTGERLEQDAARGGAQSGDAGGADGDLEELAARKRLGHARFTCGTSGSPPGGTLSPRADRDGISDTNPYPSGSRAGQRPFPPRCRGRSRNSGPPRGVADG